MPAATPPYSAVVLAGGYSSRMGSDKAWLPHPQSGVPMLPRQLALLRELQPAALLVAARTGQSLPPLPDDVIRVDDDGQSGPMAGIAAALAASGAPHLLVLAVDLPAMQSATLETLIARTKPGRGVIASTSGGPEPLVGIYPQEVLPRLHAALATSATGLQRWLNQPAVKTTFTRVNFTRKESFQNWNFPDPTIQVDP